MGNAILRLVLWDQYLRHFDQEIGGKIISNEGNCEMAHKQTSHMIKK